MIIDFNQSYPSCHFNEEHLKQRVKATLKELNTGTSNAKEGEKAALQSDEFIQKVKESKNFAQRNIINKRMKLIESKSDAQLPDSRQAEKSAELPGDELKPAEQKISKMALLQQQVASVKDIADEFKTATKAIADRSGMEQVNLAFQLGVISKEDMQAKIRSIMNL